MSREFSSQLDVTPKALEIKYMIELANGKLMKVDAIIPNCSLNLAGKELNIDLMPIELGSFDVVIGMDWLS